MYEEKIVVDENIEQKLKAAEATSYNAIYEGVERWGRKALEYIYSEEAPFPLQIELEEGGEERLNTYAKMIDQKAADLREIIEAKLLALPEYKMTGEFLKDVQKRNAIKKIIEEQIYEELIYVKELVRL